MTMMREPSMIMLLLLSAALATPTLAQTSDILGDNYGIMVPENGSKRDVPEPWLAPKYKSPRGTAEQVRIPKAKTVRPPRTTDPGYVYVPQTGRTFQNLPSLPGSERRDVSGSRHTLHSPSRRLLTGRSESRHLHGLLPLAPITSLIIAFLQRPLRGQLPSTPAVVDRLGESLHTARLFHFSETFRLPSRQGQARRVPRTARNDPDQQTCADEPSNEVAQPSS